MHAAIPTCLPRAAPPPAPLDPAVDPSKGFVRGGYSVAHFSPDRIRNFSIIAHVSQSRSRDGRRRLLSSSCCLRVACRMRSSCP